MPGLSWISGRTYLWVFFFSCWILGSTAFLVDERSCRYMTQYDTSGKIREPRNKLEIVKGALRETELMAGFAAESMDNIKSGDASPFDRLRTEDIAVTLWGVPRRRMDEDIDTWKHYADDISKLNEALNGREEQEPSIFCGDSNLRRYYIYKTRDGGTRRSKQPPKRNDPNYDGFQYWDRTLAKFGAEPWYNVNEEACSQDRIIPIKVVGGLYIRICNKGFSKIAPRIGRDNRNTDWDVEKHNGKIEQNLNHWTQYLSSALLHGVIRLELGYTVQPLKKSVGDLAFNGVLRTAEGYSGAKALLKQNPDAVEKNPDSLWMVILSIFLKKNNWESGLALNETDTLNPPCE